MKVNFLRRLNTRLVCAGFHVADHTPWFARKRLFNWLAGAELFYDFTQADQIPQDFNLCIKW